MVNRIFRSIFFVAFAIFLASVVLFMGVLYNYFCDVQRDQLKMQTDLAAQGVEREGIEYFDGLDTTGYRITWIDSDGSVLYDSRSESAGMENHLEREEIQEAFETGTGESSRYSVTLMERTLYYARRLPDGTVLRLSTAMYTVLTLFLGMAQPVCMIILAALILSLLLAYRLAKKIVAPLNRLNLEAPQENEEYEELEPLLRRIDAQQRQIRLQSRRLLQKQQEFETVTENMAEGILLLNNKGIILGINRAALRLFGADRTCVGQHILSVSSRAEISALLPEVEKGRHAEKMMELAGGRYQLNVSPVISGDTVSGAVLLALDVTEKENAEQMRREFTANVSHELKTPLHTISGCAELLENGMVKEADEKNFYSRIHAEAQRMIRLVEDIIRLSHLDEGAEDMKREETDLYTLAEETVRALLPEAEAARVTVALDGESAIILGIPQLLQSIIYNLCDNAIKYNRSGGSVTVTVRNQADSVVLSVADTGIGIPPKHLDRIFERFYRVDKSRSKELGGTGLGLSIVKHAAKLHGARVQVDSVANGGTMITVTFPVVILA